MPATQHRKAAIIGMGNVGATAAYSLLLHGLVDELVLFARDAQKAVGEKLDLEHSLPFLEPVLITATDNYADIRDSNVVVVTAGVAQKPGQTRLDVVQDNLKIISDIIPKIVLHAPDAVILLISNPVDSLTFKAAQLAHLSRGRVLGSGTMLDTARFRFHLAQSLNLNPRSIHAYILGEHGDSSFPALSFATVGGQLLTTLPDYSAAKAQAIFEEVRQAAQKIILAKGATYYAIGVVITQLVKTILNNNRSVLPVSIPLENYYGLSNISLSVPCIVGRHGVEKILTPNLSPLEQERLHFCAKTLQPFLSP